MNEFDYVVVGSGSAGAALAARLSEDPLRKVLLLDAGPDFPVVEESPSDILNGNVMSLDAHDWQFRAEVTDQRKIRFPRGKVTGGSSAVGATIALRGTSENFDEWAAEGNTEWAWSKVLPYFRRLEDDLDFHNEFHGRGGPIPIRRWRPEELLPVQQSFFEAALAQGFPEVKDHNHPQATGVGPIPSTRRDLKTRVSTAIGYLSGAPRQRANLTIRAGVLVNRVLFEGTRAVGIELSTGNGTTEEVRGRNIILSAGAIGSPAILTRSGVGAADDLRRLGVDVRLDLPGVGQNLIDHPRTGAFMVPKPGTFQQSDPFLQTIIRTTAPGSPVATEFNDLQFYMVNHFDLTLFPELQMLSASNVIFGVMTVHQRPESRGRMVVNSLDPSASPAIDLNFLATERDVEVLIDAVRTCWKLLNSAGIAERGDRPIVLSDEMVEQDEMMRYYIKLSLDSAYHPVGTARMGASGDEGAVVDERLRVHGAENLYVCDASVMPQIVNCNTNLTSIMIGERLSDWLKDS